MWFGSIPAIASLFKHSPRDTHPMATMTLLYRKYQLGSIYFLDNWPALSVRQLVINDPAIAAQVSQSSLPKFFLYPKFIAHVTGKKSMILTEGAEWRRARTLFNPGFALSHLMTLVPSIVDDTQIFHGILSDLSESQKITPIDDLLAKLTIDIMAHIILDHDLNSQTTDNELVKAFKDAVYWTPNSKLIHPIFSLNLVRAFAQWYHARRMDNYIRKVIQERLALRSIKDRELMKAKASRRPAIDLAIDAYLIPDENNAEISAGSIGNEEFEQICIDQMKTFLFAGHDTSSSTLSYIYHMLNLHPESLAKVRQEHDDVFGVSSAAAVIKGTPQLLNELPYTTAVIKETLRLFPPANGSRDGSSGFTIKVDGVEYPTKNTMIWPNVHTMHRRADLWPQPDDFIPERFLPSPHNFQEIMKDAWRPFQKGPRACIGQELAMLDIKVIMVMTLRDFDIKAEYEEWDLALGREKPGEMLDGRRGMFGHRAYQQLKATAKPADGMPVKVTRRKKIKD
ncbi:cytochrome P450 [Stipitochalara longipes BDJ]|nr:cytochrome P450 [Stipitochalara longipes BDJ]